VAPQLVLRIARHRGRDHYDVLCGDIIIGRIMTRVVPEGAPPWFWILHQTVERRGIMGEHGPASTREEAVAKLRERWDWLLSDEH
jgi:hypothetical protein